MGNHILNSLTGRSQILAGIKVAGILSQILAGGTRYCPEGGGKPLYFSESPPSCPTAAVPYDITWDGGSGDRDHCLLFNIQHKSRERDDASCVNW
mgnify:CR=1 FL=1